MTVIIRSTRFRKRVFGEDHSPVPGRQNTAGEAEESNLAKWAGLPKAATASRIGLNPVHGAMKSQRKPLGKGASSVSSTFNSLEWTGKDLWKYKIQLLEHSNPLGINFIGNEK